ncbi:MAG: hypothetical protein KME29_03805 [Calothrix sp. FI2-JRJ7]|jgi:hypothetical protein|nr:hypothetical protein [Calothrix sp. FI2-JRJ7]MBW4598745.1 hypothetical protein [Calothrix sp. FI2-JRJ7]
MESTLNNEEKAREIRRTEGESEYVADTYSYNSPRLEGVTDGIEPLRADRNDSERKLYTEKSKAVTGKVIDQLISECVIQIEAKKQEIKQLESKFSQLKSLRSELVEDENQSL